MITYFVIRYENHTPIPEHKLVASKIRKYLEFSLIIL